jgi:hypothetical protein
MIRCFFLCCLIATLPGCRNDAADRLQSGKVLDIFGLEGRWVGPVTPQTEGCGSTNTGLMTVGRTTFAFDPFQGTTVLDGTVSADGNLTGSLSRPGGGQQVVSISFSGAAKQDGGAETIAGQLVTGRCSWTVNLKRG